MKKQILKRSLLGAVALSLMLSLSGCSLGTDVWTLLRTPHLTGEQMLVQTALDAYIKSIPKEEAAAGGTYVLKYPKSGDYRSAFIFKDMNNDGTDDAIAFYRRGQEGSNVHVNLLFQQDGKWSSVSDIEGESADVERVRFGDLDGDGKRELMIGWNIDNIRDKQFVLYSITDNKLCVWDKALYSSAVVGDLTSCGHDNLLLLYAGEKNTTAQLWTLQQDTKTPDMVLKKHDSIVIDENIQQFGDCYLGKLSDNVSCAYVDGIRSSGGMVTELIYWNGTKLCTPFYDAANGKNMATYREALIPATDIDGDKVIEWPTVQNTNSNVLNSGENSSNSKENSIWYVDWNSLDYQTDESTQVVKKKFSCIMNLADGYYLRLDKLKMEVTPSYNKQTHELTLYTAGEDAPAEEILVLRAGLCFANGECKSETGSEEHKVTPTHNFKFLQEEANIQYEVWISKEKEYNLSMEQVRYMFSIFRSK